MGDSIEILAIILAGFSIWKFGAVSFALSFRQDASGQRLWAPLGSRLYFVTEDDVRVARWIERGFLGLMFVTAALAVSFSAWSYLGLLPALFIARVLVTAQHCRRLDSPPMKLEDLPAVRVQDRIQISAEVIGRPSLLVLVVFYLAVAGFCVARADQTPPALIMGVGSSLIAGFLTYQAALPRAQDEAGSEESGD